MPPTVYQEIKGKLQFATVAFRLASAEDGGSGEVSDHSL